jgi:hypothetical protein
MVLRLISRPSPPNSPYRLLDPKLDRILSPNWIRSPSGGFWEAFSPGSAAFHEARAIPIVRESANLHTLRATGRMSRAGVSDRERIGVNSQKRDVPRRHGPSRAIVQTFINAVGRRHR